MAGSKFAKQTVLITGASAGIGEALAREFARQGANLILFARRKKRLKKLADSLAVFGAATLICRGDVTRNGDLEAAVREGKARFGNIHVVVANAGFGVLGRLERLRLTDYRRQFETNVFGVLRTIYATLDCLKKSKGRLVLIGSVSGHLSTPQSSAYTMSKFAVRALADSLYSELAPDGIAVTLISPGFVKTEIHTVDRQGMRNPDAKSQVPEWLPISAHSAAASIVDAVAKRERERVVSWHGKVFVGLQRYFPGLTAGIFKELSKKLASAKTKSRK